MEFTYKRWRLMPSFKPAEVDIVGVNERGYYRRGYLVDRKGKVYYPNQLFESKADAIAFGRTHLAEQQVGIDKRQARINARKAALDKADT